MGQGVPAAAKALTPCGSRGTIAACWGGSIVGVFIFIVVVGLIIWAVMAASKAKAAKQALKDAFLGSHEGWDAYVTPDLEQVIAIDHDGRRVAVGSLADPIEVKWEDVASCEVERNGQSITATNRGSQVMGAAVGGLLLGPAGLLLGGLTGSKRNVEKVSELSLKVMIDHRAAPLHRIIFVKLPGDGIKPDSAMLKPIIQRLEHFHALLSNAIRSEDHARLSHRELAFIDHGSSEQRLAQLWELHQKGALTAEEYTVAKTRLLLGSDTPRIA